MNIARPSVALLALATSLTAQVSMVHLGTVDVAATSMAAGPSYIGNNPSAVAWNGTDLWLAGFNASGAVGTVAIVQISTPLTTPTIGTPFGVQAATPNSRGYIGLDVEGNILAASYDPGTTSPEGITAWDINGGNLWAKDARGSSGVGFDPGFFGVDSGVGWTTFGSGRRALQDSLLGTDIYVLLGTAPNAGMVINAGIGTIWRDMDYDSFAGDIYLRKGNQVIGGMRIGGNQLVNVQQLTNVTQADAVVIQNLAAIRTAEEQFVIWNDRPDTSGSKPFEDVVRAIRGSDGSALTIDYGGFVAPSGTGAYDFSYDEASGTLAICSFDNREVYLFAVSTFQEYGTGCTGAGGFVPRLTAYGDTRQNGSVTYTVLDAAPLSVGLFAFGDTQTNVPLPFSPTCPLLVTPLLLIGGVFVTGPGLPGSGTGSAVLPLPASATGLTLTCQGAILENADLAQTRTTNGIQVTFQ